MKRVITVVGVAVLAAVASIVAFAPPAHAAVGLRVSGTNVVEANGQVFVMRGVNHPHVWFTNQTSSFANIKALGANTVRVVLGSGHRGWGTSTPSDVANVINLCKQNRLICVLELHDTTGFGEQSGAASLDQAVSFWIGLRDVLVGQENYVVINIGNEPIGNNNAAQWTQATAGAVQRMRSNGFEHLLMVDAPNWGQDWQNVMRTNAQTIWNADSQRNTVFSIHMYSVYNTASSIVSYFNDFRAMGLPLVVGEFGWRFNPNEVDHDTILAEAQSRGMGYLGWSWSGNSDPILDMTVSFDPNQLTTWGQRIFTGPNGIRATAREATIYSGATTSPPVTSSPPVTTSSPPPAGGSCTAAYTIVGQWSGGFQGEVRVTAGGSAITGWTASWTFTNGQTVNHAWNAAVTSNGSSVTARNVSYNGRLEAGASTTFGFLGSWNGANNAPTVTCSAS